MDPTPVGGCRELDFESFDALAKAVDDAAVALDASDDSLSDDLVPYRRHRVISYAGSPGATVCCPACGIGGKRVDEWGAYFCEACGFTNTEERSTSDVDE
jgi:hypothetical protein